MRIIILLLLLFTTTLAPAQPPPLMLAKTYHADIDVSRYWISEKLDGVRAYWDGEHLLTRQGNRIAAPAWFTAPLPADTPLDGELWLGRGRFEALSSIVRKQSARDALWRQVGYHIFDLPALDAPFDRRVLAMRGLSFAGASHIHIIRQFRLDSQQALQQSLSEYEARGAEGLMLHLGSSRYEAGRSDHILKYKSYEDAEAKVLAHIPGQGKYEGMMGSMLVEDEQGLRFRIGTGFSDAQRRAPPPIGSIVTYKYQGRTRKGIPRFASFMRIRRLP